MGQNQRPLILGICGILLLCLLKFVLLPAMDYKGSMEQQVKRNRNAYGKLEALTSEYAQLLQKRKTQTKGLNKNKGTLFAVVEKTARELHINRNIDSVRPQKKELENNLTEEEVTLRFKGLYQAHLVKFLYTVEKSLQGISVKNINIKQTKNKLLDVDIALLMVTSEK